MPRLSLVLLLLAVPSVAADGVATEVASRAGANVQRPTWSPDGSQLAWEANFHDRKVIELYAGDPGRKRFQRVMPVSPGASNIAAGFGSGQSGGGKVAHDLTWAPPHVGRFVFTASTGANDYDLYLMGGGAVSPGPGADGNASWSPDGEHIVFTSSRTGQGDLYLVHTPSIGAPPKRLTRDPSSSELFASWSPDSERLVFVGRGQSGDNVWMLPSLTGMPVQLTTWSGIQTAPTFSPDGARVAFYANKEAEDRFDLYVMDAREGAKPAKVATDVLVNPLGPQWTPRGDALVVTCNDDDAYDPICVAPATGGSVRPLDLGTVGHGDLDLVTASDGSVWLAYAAQGRTVDEERSFKRLFVAKLDL